MYVPKVRFSFGFGNGPEGGPFGQAQRNGNIQYAYHEELVKSSSSSNSGNRPRLILIEISLKHVNVLNPVYWEGSPKKRLFFI